MPANAAVYGCQGMELLASEEAFFREAQPFGFILFARNCADPAQLRRLCDGLREAVDNSLAPIFIDQEGGRVARLKPPHWRARPAARVFGDLYEADPTVAREAAYLSARLTAYELVEVGINADCAPVLDIPSAGAHDVIGDRAYSLTPSVAIELGRAVIEGFLDGGVMPVIKHIPGHGRAAADSHHALPRVAASHQELSTHDFVAFRSLNHAPFAMTAHVVYEALDPQRPATTSPKIVRDIIRGEIGFDGFLLSDDISMAALRGPMDARTKAALFAGCDAVLHCNGRMDEMKDVAMRALPLTVQAERRARAALAQIAVPVGFDTVEAEARLDAILGVSA